MNAEERPVVRLRPKVAVQPLRFGAPWVYADQLVLDRRTKAIPAGSLVELQDAERRPLGLAAFNAGSKIAARMLNADPAAEVGLDWFAARIGRALALRETLFDAPFYRLIHAEADGMPGVIIDRFGDAIAVQPNAAWADLRFETLAEALRNATGATTVVRNAGGRARALEGLSEEMSVIGPEPTAPIEVPMNGAVYLADLMGGQKTGLFYDQRPNHAFAARLARGRRVLDVFAHVGGFGLAALAAGATSALAVDGSAAALELAAGGARASGVADRFETRKGDAFDVMAALAAEDARFGVVVCDPPSFAPNRAALEAGLRAYERTARLGATLGRAGRVPRPLLVQPCRRSCAVPRGVAARDRSGRALRADPAHGLRRARPSGASAPGRERLPEGAVPAAGAVSGPERVLIDANVLFPSVLREVVLGAAAAGGLAPLWSARILEEWARATRRLPEGAEAAARAEIARLRACLAGCRGLRLTLTWRLR